MFALQDLLKDVARFLGEHDGEIGVLEFSHFNSAGRDQLDKLKDMVDAHLDGFLAPYDEDHPRAVFDIPYSLLKKKGHRCVVVFGEAYQLHFMDTPWSNDSVYANSPYTGVAERWNLNILRKHAVVDEREPDRPLRLFWTVTPRWGTEQANLIRNLVLYCHRTRLSVVWRTVGNYEHIHMFTAANTGS